MGNNKPARDELIKRYGKECFIDKLHLRKDKNRKYTSTAQMQKMKELTYHHIIEESKGGKSTIENGALLSKENHQWFHQQSLEARKYMNAVFQVYKKKVDNGQIGKCQVVYVDDLQVDYLVKPTEFVIETRTKGTKAKNRGGDNEQR